LLEVHAVLALIFFLLLDMFGSYKLFVWCVGIWPIWLCG